MTDIPLSAKVNSKNSVETVWFRKVSRIIIGITKRMDAIMERVRGTNQCFRKVFIIISSSAIFNII